MGQDRLSSRRETRRRAGPGEGRMGRGGPSVLGVGTRENTVRLAEQA